MLVSLLIVITVLYSLPSGYPLGTAIITGVVMVLLPLLLIIAMVTIVSFLSAISRRNRTFHTEHTITFDESGLKEATSYNTSTYTWKAIQSVVQTRRHLFLFTAHDSAHVIPRRAVASDEDWRNLHEMVLDFIDREAAD